MIYALKSLFRREFGFYRILRAKLSILFLLLLLFVVRSLYVVASFPLKLIVDVCLPAEGRGSYKSLVEAGIKKECFRKYFSLFYNHFGVDPCGTTWPEMMCCERRDSRANATDVFIKDQSLSIITLSKNGEYRLLVKEFNQVDWIVLQK